MEELAAAQVVLVGPNIGSGQLGQSTPFILTQEDAERSNDVLCDLILDCKYVRHLTVEAFRPQVEAAGYVD